MLRRASLDRRSYDRSGDAVRLGGRQRGQPVCRPGGGSTGQRGHRVLIVAPSQSAALVRDSRRAIRCYPDGLLEDADGEPLVARRRRGAAVLAHSPARGLAAGRRRADDRGGAERARARRRQRPRAVRAQRVERRPAPLARAERRQLPRAHRADPLHAAHRPLSRLLFGRLDARTASYVATRELLQRFFPAEYRVIPPGADPPTPGDANGVPEIVLVAEGGTRRACARPARAAALPREADGTPPSGRPRPTAPPATLGKRLARAGPSSMPSEFAETEALARADIAVLASEGDRPTPGTLVRALGRRRRVVASRLPVYEEVLADGEHGLMFEPGEARRWPATSAADLRRGLWPAPAAAAAGGAGAAPGAGDRRAGADLRPPGRHPPR